jgi:hypothetical protein
MRPSNINRVAHRRLPLPSTSRRIWLSRLLISASGFCAASRLPWPTRHSWMRDHAGEFGD